MIGGRKKSKAIFTESTSSISTKLFRIIIFPASRTRELIAEMVDDYCPLVLFALGSKIKID